MDNILDCREKRELYQKELLQKYPYTLIVIRPNYPGTVKGNIYSNYTVYKTTMDLAGLFDVLQVRHSYTAEGLVFFVMVSNYSKGVKSKCIEFEESHLLGRLVDIDVYDSNREYSRADFKLSPRKCFICNDDAVVCVRSMKHTLAQISEYFVNKVEKLVIHGPIENSISNLVSFSMINELCRQYGYGCVTVNTNGSHNDMNFTTFLKSIEAISNGIRHITGIEYRDFYILREHGINLEQKMFDSTGGINTHKGAIFIMLLMTSALLSSKVLEDMPSIISELSKQLINDFDGAKESNGLKIYSDYNIKGVRESALSGFSNIFHTFLPYYEKTMDIEDLSMLIMSKTDDTNVIHRSNLKNLRYLQERAELILGRKDCYKELSDWCVDNNISTGGSADLISSTLFLWMIKRHYKTLKEEMQNGN